MRPFCTPATHFREAEVDVAQVRYPCFPIDLSYIAFVYSMVAMDSSCPSLNSGRFEYDRATSVAGAIYGGFNEVGRVRTVSHRIFLLWGRWIFLKNLDFVRGGSTTRISRVISYLNISVHAIPLSNKKKGSPYEKKTTKNRLERERSTKAREGERLSKRRG